MESSTEEPVLLLRGGTTRALHLQPQCGAFDGDDGCSLRFLLLVAVMPSASSRLQQLSKGASGRPKQSPYTPLMGVVTQDSSSSSSDDEECGKRRSWVDHFGGGMVAKAKVKVGESWAKVKVIIDHVMTVGRRTLTAALPTDFCVGRLSAT